MAKQPKQNVFFSEIFSKEMIRYYRTHIVEFVEDIIFAGDVSKKLSDQQKEGLIAIMNNKRTSIKSGKGIGKTMLISCAIMWFLCCFDNPKIIVSAPTAPTLFSSMWPEISLWLNQSLIKDIFEHTATKLFLKEYPKTWFCEPRTARDPISMQGIHQESLLIVVDESSGLKQEIFDSLDTTLTGKNNKICLIGNPNLSSGAFADTFGKFKNKWHNLTFSALESPWVSKEQIEYYELKYGKHSDLYRVNILGQFPEGNPESFLKLSDVNMAVLKYEDIQSMGEISVGIDVARYGNDLTVLYWRQGYKVYPAITLAKNSIPEAVQLVIDTVQTIRKQTGYDKRIKVKVDDTGVGGGVTDYLKLDRENNIEVVPCNNGGKGNEIYQNEVSMMWGNFKDQLINVALPDDSTLVEELSSRKWKLSQSGKIMIEPKSEYKKVFGSSPDRADALMLCFFNKESEKTVIRNFDPLDTSIVKDRVDYMGENKYCSVFYSRDITSSITYGTWDNNRLYIFDEHQSTDSLVYVVSNILSHGQLFRLIGNDKMFSLKGDDLASKFRKYKLSVYENFYFNEISAIETLNNLISQKKLIINSNCKKLIGQLQEWKMENSKFDMEDKYGLCYSLLYLISELKVKIENKQQLMIQTNAYTPIGYQEEEKSNHWMLF